MKVQRVLGILCLLVGFSVSAHAQASRTWVSGVGDDANPCSRTAPCKTFAGAISKTAAGGEISVLDPGGYGALTITKSITIEGADFVASILVSGTNGIVVSAGANDTVYLRNLTINGIGSGLNGIRVLSAGRFSVENCVIFGFTSGGIDLEPSTQLKTTISNTTIRNNNGFGIFSKASGAGSNVTTLSHVEITGTTGNGIAGNGSGFIADGAASVAHIANSVLASNITAGLFVRNGADVSVYSTSIFRNSTGISVGDAGGGAVHLSASNVFTNVNGIAIISGAVVSHGNNAITDNGGTQATSSIIGQQ